MIEQTGDVSVENTSLSDLKVEKLRDPDGFGVGNVTLRNVTTDSDTTIVDIPGTSTIESSMIVGDVQIKSTGDVTLDDVTIDDTSIVDVGDVLIKGNVPMDIKAKFSGDVEIKSAGGVTLDFVEGSDVSIADNGDVDIISSDLRGDLKITSNDAVTVMGNDFFLEDISITNNMGPVIVDNNVNLSLSIIENDVVMVTDNTFTDAEISKNTGGVDINGNTGEKLNCSDNDPPPTGGGNTITELADGQCVGF